MPSIIKQAQIDMQTALASITDGQGNIIFQLVRNWNSQLQRLRNGQGEAISLPAAFLETLPGNVDALGMGVSLYSSFCFRVHILHMQLDGGNELNLAQDLDVFDIRDAVIVGISGIKPKNCSTLSNHTEAMDTDHDNIYHYTVDFVCCLVDTKGSPLDPDSDAYITQDPPVELDLLVNQQQSADNVFDTTFDTTFD